MGAAIGFSFETKTEKRKTREVDESLTAIRRKNERSSRVSSVRKDVGGGETFERAEGTASASRKSNSVDLFSTRRRLKAVSTNGGRFFEKN
jgi:hypothetical protein